MAIKTAGQQYSVKFFIEVSQKPSAIHGRLREYNMAIMQCQKHSAQVVCCIQGQL
jgi:hypothetical protein